MKISQRLLPDKRLVEMMISKLIGEDLILENYIGILRSFFILKYIY